MSLCPSCNRDVGEVAKFCPACGASIVRAPAEDDYTGRIIAGKFRVEALIGEGGMGKVFRATQLSLDKTVVLKVLRQSLLSDARTVARFQREAKAASRLNHPNSISVIDFGQSDDGALYIAMEHVSGCDLHHLLSTEGPLPEKRIARIVAQVLSALSDAHAAGVIHRDLKPENIMVEQRRGEPDFVKVLDFGIAKIQESDGSEGQALTRAGFVCGTPEYMSPEQARGGMLDPRSDLYAVGVILYQCATNLLPFEADSAVALATMHLTATPVPPRQRRDDVLISDAFEALILKALAKDPNDRPQNAEEFRADLLAAVQEGQETRIQSMPQMPTLREERASRRSSRAVGHPVSSDPDATRLARTPSWATSPGAISEETTVAATHPGPAPTTRRLSTARLATIVGGSLVAIALLVGGGWIAYQQLARGRASIGSAPAADARSSGSESASTKEPAADINLAGDSAVPAAPGNAEPKAGESRAQVFAEQGDRAVASRKYDEALVLYSRAYEAEHSAAMSKRIALGYMLKNDLANSSKWLRQYLQDGGTAADAEYIERHLRGQ